MALFSATACLADTIVLKNGRTIVADSVREKDGKIEYEIGDDTYRIPKSLVDKIESSPAATTSPLPETSSATVNVTRPQNLDAYTKAVPVAPKATSMDLHLAANDPALRVVRDGKVDLDVLNQLDHGGNANSAAAGYLIAGLFEYEHGNRDNATRYMERALGFGPDNAAVLANYAALLIQNGRPREAIDYAERATLIAPGSAETFTVLGYAYFNSDRGRDAITAWEKALELHPDDKLQAVLDRAKRESNVEANFTERDTGRFTLRYEGSVTQDTTRQAIVSALDKDYDELSNDLGISPSQNIPVILYTEKAFFDVTQAPTWTGALNDGKLRIPIRGVDYVTPQLARVLKHELTHSFVNQAAGGRCPQWLNEGIAQMEEGRTLDGRVTRLALIYKGGNQIPLDALEGSFMKFSNAEALIAYDESLAAALYIRDTYGTSEFRRLLEHVSEGGTFQQALVDVLHEDYPRFERDLADYLSSKSGL